MDGEKFSDRQLKQTFVRQNYLLTPYQQYVHSLEGQGPLQAETNSHFGAVSKLFIRNKHYSCVLRAKTSFKV